MPQSLSTSSAVVSGSPTSATSQALSRSTTSGRSPRVAGLMWLGAALMAPWYATLVVLDENDGGPGVLGRQRAADWGALHLHLEVRGVLEREHEPEVLDDGFEHGPRLSRLLLVAGGLDEASTVIARLEPSRCAGIV